MSNRKEPYVLGLDLDNTVADYTDGLRNYMITRYGYTVDDLPEPVNYSFARTPWPFESTADYIDTHMAAVADGLYRHLEPLEGAIEAIHALKDEGVHVHVVTHRLMRNKTYQRVVADTVEWLDYVGLPYHSLGFTGQKERIRAHSYAEDAPENIEAIRASGLKVFTYDRLYNQPLAGERIHTWLNDGLEQILTHKAELGL